MELTTFMVEVYCVVDDWLGTQPRPRSRGPEPTLSDSEVLTMEIVGEYLGIDTDKGLHDHFRRHYADRFPALGRVHRTTFARQAANLWVLEERLRRELGERVAHDPLVSIVDSFPVPVCRFARDERRAQPDSPAAYRCRRFRGLAAYGRDEMAKRTYYGLRAHLRAGTRERVRPGVIAASSLAPANEHDVAVAEVDLLEGVHGWALGDRNYRSPEAGERLGERGLELLAPPKKAKGEREPWPRWLVNKRRRVETVIGQLAERYHAKRVWARDEWHLRSRWARKLLSHTVAVLLRRREGLPPLRFAELTAE